MRHGASLQVTVIGHGRSDRRGAACTARHERSCRITAASDASAGHGAEAVTAGHGRARRDSDDAECRIVTRRLARAPPGQSPKPGWGGTTQIASPFVDVSQNFPEERLSFKIV